MGHRLVAESIVVNRGDKTILSDISICCATGEIVGLLGRNGAGKSSLLKAIFGTLSTESRYVSINGNKVDQLFAQAGTANLLPQHRFIPQNLTVHKAINLFCKSWGKQAFL